MMTFLEKTYGRYPFETVGAIVDNAPELGYALETQTKPVFDRAPDEATLLHELAHQWYGNAVTLKHLAGHLAQRGLRGLVGVDLVRAHRRPDRGAASSRPARARPRPREEPTSGTRRRPTPAPRRDMFDGTIYDRGAMTLQALREKIGDRAFFTLMRPLVRGQQVRQRVHAAVHRARRAGVAARTCVSSSSVAVHAGQAVHHPGRPGCGRGGGRPAGRRRGRRCRRDIRTALTAPHVRGRWR